MLDPIRQLEEFNQALNDAFSELESMIEEFKSEKIDVSHQINPLHVKFIITMSSDYIVRHSKAQEYLRSCLASRNVSFITFVFHLDQKFPFSAPQVYCMSQLMIPFELNDGRELLETINKGKWSSLVLLKNIVLDIPEFLTLVYENSASMPFLRGLGCYTTNNFYDFEGLSLNSYNYLLYCEKHDRINDLMQEKYAIASLRILCFTPTALLEFEIFRAPKSTFLKVVKVKPFQTLLYVKRKQTLPNYVCFAFGKQATKLYQDQEVEFAYYLIPNVDEMLEKLLELAALNDASVNNNTVLSTFSARNGPTHMQEPPQMMAPANQSREVTSRQPRANQSQAGKANEGKEQEQLLKRIAELESLIEDKLDHDLVQELVGLYGKATEIFSSNPSSDFMVFTMKTQSLLSRPDILAVLDSNRNVPLLDMDFAPPQDQGKQHQQSSNNTNNRQTNVNQSANSQLLDLTLGSQAAPQQSGYTSNTQGATSTGHKIQPTPLNQRFRFNSDDEDEEEKKDDRDGDSDEEYGRRDGVTKGAKSLPNKAAQYFGVSPDEVGQKVNHEMNLLQTTDDFLFGVSKPITTAAPPRSDLDLLGLDLELPANKHDQHSPGPISSFTHGKIQSDFELLGGMTTSSSGPNIQPQQQFNPPSSGGKLSDKLTKRQVKRPDEEEYQGENSSSKRQEEDQFSEPRRLVFTPSKSQSNSASSPREKEIAGNPEPENDILRLQKLLSSNSSKKSQGSSLKVRRDSYSDEENRYKIG